MVGSLVYIASQTRPDILYAVCAHACQSTTPIEADRLGVFRILQYIKGTRTLGLRLHCGEGIILYATVDASYASHLDFKPHTGCTLHLGRRSGSVFSLSKKQTVTADSSTVAEVIAAHLAAHEIICARNFLQELEYPQLLYLKITNQLFLLFLTREMVSALSILISVLTLSGNKLLRKC
jgi:hypothetical protein